MVRKMANDISISETGREDGLISRQIQFKSYVSRICVPSGAMIFR